ncbi:hypothetical protein ACS0TY_017433 [Phlomoides rotata]
MLWKALERPLLKTGSPSVIHKENVHQVEPRQLPQASEPDVSGQPTTSGVKEGEIILRPQKGPKPADTNTAGSHWFFNHAWEMLLKGKEFDMAHFITDVSGKYPRLWALKGAHPVTVNRWYKFGVLASIRTIAPGFREISELPDWVGNAVQES